MNLAAGLGARWLELRDVAAMCETDCGTRANRREGPSHIVSSHGVSDVSHAAPPELVASMVNAATTSYGIRRKAAA